MTAFFPVLDDLPDVSGKRVLVRADLNVPVRAHGAGPARVVDDLRIRALHPTIEWLTSRGAEVTLCSHLGRPGGVHDPSLSMDPVRVRIAELMPGVRVMENLRFDPGEEANDARTVLSLIDGQDLFVNDAFASLHRRHASILGPPAYLPSAAGRLVEEEVGAVENLMDHARRPFCAVIGGERIPDKLGALRVLVERADCVLIGGAVCFTFLAAMGHEVGSSLVDEECIDQCIDLLASGRRIVLPNDIVAIAPDATPQAEASSGNVSSNGNGRHSQCHVFGDDIKEGWVGMDIGPITAANFAREVGRASTVLWNGPMGVIEDPRFTEGSAYVGRAISEGSCYSFVGGGSTVEFLCKGGLDLDIDHVSTGITATLALIEDGDLPGLAALRASHDRVVVGA